MGSIAARTKEYIVGIFKEVVVTTSMDQGLLLSLINMKRKNQKLDNHFSYIYRITWIRNRLTWDIYNKSSKWWRSTDIQYDNINVN